MIQIKKDPWYIHLAAQTILFFLHPVKYFTVRIKLGNMLLILIGK
jgi:hypothetical protein